MVESLKPAPSGAEAGCCSGKVFQVAGSLLLLYGLDQATKLWTVRNFELGDRKPLFGDWFEWVHFSNTGAAFGIMQDSNRFFIGLSLFAAIAVCVMLRKNLLGPGLNFWGLVFLLPGILGNLTDRILHGYVVDFLLVDLGFWPAHPWPAFNVADSCICAAVALMLLASVREEVGKRRGMSGGSH